MQIRNSFCRDVVLHSVYMIFRDEDNVLDKIYHKQIYLEFYYADFISYIINKKHNHHNKNPNIFEYLICIKYKLLISSRSAMLALSKTTSPETLFRSDWITLYLINKGSTLKVQKSFSQLLKSPIKCTKRTLILRFNGTLDWENRCNFASWHLHERQILKHRFLEIIYKCI